MIAHLKGKILKKTSKGVILQTGDIGYLVFLTAPTLESVEENNNAEFFIHHHLKEDISNLYGFNSYEQLEFFVKLISINGIGPRIGLEILSTPEDQIKSAILNEDQAFICKIPGIGKKTAQRIIIELKDKIDPIHLNRTHKAVKEPNSEALDALTKLGYQRKDVIQTLKDIPSEITQTEEIITYFLKHA